jgi:hypothetical protein
LYLPQPSDHNYRAEVTAHADAPIARDEVRRVAIKMAKMPELKRRPQY